MTRSLDTPVRYLKGIGPKKAGSLNRLGIQTIEDLLYYFPRRYEDRNNFIFISELREGQVYTIKAKVLSKGRRQSFRRRGFSIIEVGVADASGALSCVWFNQPFLLEYFQPGQSLILYGKVERYSGKLQMHNPEFEIISSEEDGPSPGAPGLDFGRIVPI